MNLYFILIFQSGNRLDSILSEINRPPKPVKVPKIVQSEVSNSSKQEVAPDKRKRDVDKDNNSDRTLKRTKNVETTGLK